MLLNPPAARLLVLVPEGDLPVVELAQRIWALAKAAGAAVLLLGLAEHPTGETQTRRRLAVLQSHTQYEAVPVSTRVACGPDWVTAVRQVRRPGDCVICFADQAAPAGPWGWGHQPLAAALRNQLHTAVYVITDVPLPRVPHTTRWEMLVGWAVSLTVIGAFLVGQAWLQSSVPGGAGRTLLAVSVIAEFGLLGLLQRQRL